MGLWTGLAVAGGVVLTYLGLRRAFFGAAAASTSPSVVPTAADLAAAPPAWTDADYRAFAQAMARIGVAAPDALLFMTNESGLKPTAAHRATTGAIDAAGLNQITRVGATALGVTPEAAQAYLDHLVTLSVAEQIPIVERSLAAGLRTAGVVRPANVGVLYAVNGFPGRVRTRGTAPGAVLATAGEGIYESNAGLDFNKDGKITIQDLSDFLQTNILPRPVFRGALAKLRAALGQPGAAPRFL